MKNSLSNRKYKVTKISLIFILIHLFFSQNTYAQYLNEEYWQLTGGLVAGTTFMQVDGDGYKGYDKMGWTGGGILYLPLGDVNMPFDATLAFSLEVLYTQKGALGKGPIINTGVTRQDIQLHYAEIPVQINLYRGARKSGFGMGFALGYLGYSEETITEYGNTIIKNAKPFKKLDLNYVLTFNVHLWKGFFLSPRFQYSMLSIRSNNAMYGGRNEQFNNVWAIRLMYLIKNKG